MMLVIPLKVTKQIDIASPLFSWVIHKDKRRSNGIHLDILSEKNKNYSSDNGISKNKKNSNDGLNGNINGVNSSDEDPAGGTHSLPSTHEAREGLRHLSTLRNNIALNLVSRELPADMDFCEKILDSAMEYHAALLECENRGFPTVNGEVKELNLQWECAFENDREPLSRSNLLYERASILFNIGALESFIAPQEDMTTRKGLTSAAKRYNIAASVYAYTRSEVLPKLSDIEPNPSHADPTTSSLTLDLTPSCLKMCENMLLAQGQACMYEMARFRPMHQVLAKISMGAADIYNEALQSSQDKTVRAKMPDAGKWEAHFKAMSMVFRGRAEYHESICVRECAIKKGKPGHGLEIARLKMAESLCEQASLIGNKGSIDLTAVTELKLDIIERKIQAEQENDNMHKEKVQSPHDVEPTRGQRISKIEPLNKKITDLSQPLFHFGVKEDPTKTIVDEYLQESKDILSICSMFVQKETEFARNALAKVNLPHAVKAYASIKQGIPHHIWQKVEALQHSREIESLKEGLRDLKELSDSVHETAKDINDQLLEDLKMDIDFRKNNISFSGYSVEEVQQSTRRNMDQCGKILANAKTGDTVLLQYLQKFESDPKLKLLQYNKQQLDNLAHSSKGSDVKTHTLSKYLNELSSLIHERELLLQYLHAEIGNLDMKSHAAKVVSSDNPDSISSFESFVEGRLSSYRQIKNEIEANVEKQPNLLYTVLNENESFVNADEGFVRRIEEGLSLVKVVRRNLEEGRNFYNMIMPRLNQLKEYVSFMSVRLAVQRFDYEDSAKEKSERLRQEIEDAKVAKTLSMRNNLDASLDMDPLQFSRSRPSTHENDYGDPGGHTNDLRNSVNSVAPPSLSVAETLPPPPISDYSNNLLSHNPHQPGYSDLHSYLNESPANRPSSENGLIRGPLPPAPPSIPSARAPSMQSFCRQTATRNDDVYQPPPYLSQPPSAGQPGIYYQSNYNPAPTRVDDEKVARLVAMDFDPAEVLIALQKYDNNFDQALNDLLS